MGLTGTGRWRLWQRRKGGDTRGLEAKQLFDGTVAAAVAAARTLTGSVLGAQHFQRCCDQQLREELAASPVALGNMRGRERIAHALRIRLAMIVPHIGARRLCEIRGGTHALGSGGATYLRHHVQPSTT